MAERLRRALQGHHQVRLPHTLRAEAIDQLDETEKQDRKTARKEKKEEMFSALVSSKPDSKNWGKGNLQLALDYKGIMTVATSKGKKKEELLKVWQTKGNSTLEAGEEEEEVEEEDGAGGGGGRADARGEGGGGEVGRRGDGQVHEPV